MQTLKFRGMVAVAVLGLGVAHGQVPAFQFQEGGVVAQPGDTFYLNLDLVVGDPVNDVNPPHNVLFNGQVIAIDWWLGTSSAGKSLIRLDGRTFQNGFVAPLGTPAAIPVLLDYQNSGHNSAEWVNEGAGGNLGATVNGGPPVGKGTHWISKLTVTLDDNIPLGTYPLFTTRTDGFGWGDSAGNTAGATQLFGDQASLQILVIPEPHAAFAVAGMGLLAFAAFRRFRAART